VIPLDHNRHRLNPQDNGASTLPTHNKTEDANLAGKPERIEGKREAEANAPADAVAEELLRLLALADESARLDLLRVAAGLHHPARGALRALVPAAAEVGDAGGAPAAVAVVVVPTPTHVCGSEIGESESVWVWAVAVYFWSPLWWACLGEQSTKPAVRRKSAAWAGWL